MEALFKLYNAKFTWLSKRLKAYRNSIGNPIFTEENCESLLGLDIGDLITLTGIYGLISDDEILDWNYSLRGSYPVCELGLYSGIKGANGPDEIYVFFDAKKRIFCSISHNQF